MDYQAILDRKLKALFPNAGTRQKVSAVLESYGVEKYEREADRVRIAILKLSTINIESVQIHTEMAKQDYRDVLSWAEYPKQSKNWSMPEGEKKEMMIRSDREDYKRWLAE